MKTSKLVLLLASTLLTLAALHTTAQAQDAVCTGLTGAAFGQCTAAVAVGCDGSITQPAGCTKIEGNLTRLTGETAPWVIGPCSCYSYDEALSFTLSLVRVDRLVPAAILSKQEFRFTPLKRPTPAGHRLPGR